MNKKLKGVVFVLFVFIVSLSFGQTITVSGTVTDSDNLPLPGVNIQVKERIREHPLILMENIKFKPHREIFWCFLM